MISEADLNILVSNVVSENLKKHCRLCLKDISEKCVNFEDCVSLDKYTFEPLNKILTELFGEQIIEDIPGVDAVCLECAEKAIQSKLFFEQTKKTTQLLNKIFDNLTAAVNIDLEITDKFDRLYIVVGENESKVMLIDKEDQDNKKTAVERSSARSYNCPKFQEIVKKENTCCTCAEQFETEDDLIAHKKTVHDFDCPNCDKVLSSHKSLMKHIDKAHTSYVCQRCGISCEGLDKLHAHEEKYNRKTECPKCGKLYLTNDYYVNHVQLCLAEKLDPHPFRAQIKKTHFCEKCGKGYSTTAGLRVHNRFVHGNAKPHICEHCGKAFTAPSYLKTHLIKHTGEKKFNCEICTKNFVSAAALLYHTRRHTGEKPYSCKQCSEKFVNASARAEHIKYKHTVPKLVCDICNRKCYTASFLRQHRQRHHDPCSKLYVGRSLIPPNIPGEQNMRTKTVDNREHLRHLLGELAPSSAPSLPIG